MRVDVICRAGCLIAKSRFVDRRVLVDGPEEAYFAEVRHFLALNHDLYTWVLPVTDTDVRGLALRVDEAWVQQVFPARQAPEVVEALLEKPAMEGLLRRAGVTLPDSTRIATPWELIEFADAAGWPVMLKPVDGVGGGGVVRVRCAEQAVEAVASVGASYPALMAQAFVPGPVASCQVVYSRGTPVGWATSFKIRTWPGPYGPSSAVTFAPIPGVAEQLPMIGEALGFHGVLSLDMIVDERTGRPIIIEVNPRPAGIMSRARRGGVDFSAALRQMLFGIEPVAHTRGTRTSFTASAYPQDLVRCLDENDFTPWRDWLSVANLVDLPWNDPAVFLQGTRTLVARFVRRN